MLSFFLHKHKALISQQYHQRTVLHHTWVTAAAVLYAAGGLACLLV